ncbi:hypothetical protein FQN54_001687 [Arachnomyces sp. PD_36]|nr:hypothetical protein FQN54_001687 [Arachnomyces sp. PD_36]
MSEGNAPVGAALPELSKEEFEQYNRIAEHMDRFHSHFRKSWTLLYDACLANHVPENMPTSEFILIGLGLCKELDTHHLIEEHYVFPQLGTRMPAFQGELDLLLNQHKEIHVGLEKLEIYLEGCESGEGELKLEELKGIMDGFGTVLWEHMDDEVRELGAENMRKYWTLEEMQTSLPI